MTNGTLLNTYEQYLFDNDSSTFNLNKNLKIKFAQKIGK
jgi:hypothetical protein